MKAIVCDQCGKIVLMEEDFRYGEDKGVFYLVSNQKNIRVDLCEECAEKIIATVKKE